MSTTQPKALQLADCLETDQEHLPVSRSEIAAELRRLHTETANQQDWYTEWQKWEHASKNFERQRDELLKALNEYRAKAHSLTVQRDELRGALLNTADRLQEWVDWEPPYDEALNDRELLARSRAIAKAIR